MKFLWIIVFIGFMFFSCKNELQINAFADINSVEQYQDYVTDGVKLMFFYSPTCSLCDRQRDEISVLFAEEELLNVGFARVNYLTHPEIFNQEEVIGFPTILIFKNGELQHHLLGANNTYASLREKLVLLLE
jgi:thioredoxin-related protein